MANLRISKNMIREAVVISIRNTVSRAWRGTQQSVPVDTGKLKRTAFTSNLENGAMIKYVQPYSSFVERGLTAKFVDVRGYWHPNGYYAKAHRRWQPERKPVKFIEKPMRKEFSGLANTFDSELRRVFVKVRRV
jgi:hypothetical protein